MLKYFDDYVKWQTKDISNIIIFTVDIQHSTETCELVAYRIVTVGEWKQKEKPMEKIGLWDTNPPNGIHNGHNERLENRKLLDWKCTRV